MFQFLITSNLDSVIKNAIQNLQNRFNNMSYFVSNGVQYVPIYLKDLVNLIGTQNEYDFTNQMIIRFVETNFDIANYLKNNNYIVSNTYIDSLQSVLYDFIGNSIYSLMKEFIESIFNVEVFNNFAKYENLDLNKENSKFQFNGYTTLKSDNIITYLIQKSDE